MWGRRRPDLSKNIAKLISRSPTVQRGWIGYKFADCDSGVIIGERNATRFFAPASNTKLYTTALALARLGANYKFITQLRTTGAWVPGKVALANLQLVGGGDPNLSGRAIPYTVDSQDGDPLAAIKELADQLAEKGIREIDGDVTGVATRYPGDLYPNGWTIDDSIYGYGAPVSALSLNDNTISITVRPTEAGELAQIELRPQLEHFIFLNEVVTDTSNETKIRIWRAPGTSEVTLSGSIGSMSREWKEDLALDDPALFAAEALVQALRERGIVVRGTARSQYRDLNEVSDPLHGTASSESGTLLASHESAPLSQIIQVINKVSQNLHAEMLLREVGVITHGVGTLEAGVAERQMFLQQIGITPEGTGFDLQDGSGLARQDLTTPDATVALLRYMWQRPDRQIWLDSFPIGGLDGSLEHRFQGLAGATRIHGKTGSYSHVNALSGYIERRLGRWLAFSVMVNGTDGHEREVQNFIDRLCALSLR